MNNSRTIQERNELQARLEGIQDNSGKRAAETAGLQTRIDTLTAELDEARAQLEALRQNGSEARIAELG